MLHRSLVVVLLALTAPRAGAEPLALEITGKTSTYVVATRDPAAQYILLLGSLAPHGSNRRVSVRTEACAGPERLPRAAGDVDGHWKSRLGKLQAAIAEYRRADLVPTAPLIQPPREKTFHVFLGTHDLENARRYQPVPAVLHPLVGRHCQVYVDKEDAGLPHLDATVRDLTRTFDQEIHPWYSEHLGQVDDIDRDGRFTIFLTRWLGKLQHGQTRLDGFVRASDFRPEHRAPFGHGCDMLYLNAELQAGPRLRTVLAHEYTHAVLLCERHRAGGKDEESWLHEGLAHVAEGRMGYDVKNVDYRVSAYLAAPERFPLVMPDYYGEGQWRNPGVRGAAYLFLQYCGERDRGRDFLRRFAQSPLRGLDNVECITRQPFASLFREYALTLLGPQHYGRFHFPAPFAPSVGQGRGELLCGPRMLELPLVDGKAEASLAGSAVAIFRLHGAQPIDAVGPDAASPLRRSQELSTSGYTRISVEADSPGMLQATLVPLPAGMPRLALGERRENGGWRLTVQAHHQPISLRGLAWQCAGAAKAAEGEVSPAAWFDTVDLMPGKVYASAFLNGERFAGRGPATFRIWGEDAQGRPTGSWLTSGGAKTLE